MVWDDPRVEGPQAPSTGGLNPMPQILPEDRLFHAPLPFRPKLTWPGGARLAVWVCPNIEHYEFLPAAIRQRDP